MTGLAGASPQAVDLADLPGGVVRYSDVTNLSVVHQGIHRPEALLNRRVPVGLVEVVHVDVVGGQPSEACIDSLVDCAVTQAPVVGRVTHRVEHFGRNQDIVTASLQGGPENSLRLTGVVRVSCIEHIYPRRQGTIDHRARVALAHLGAESHRPEHDARHP